MKTVDANTAKKIHDLMRLAGSSNVNEAAAAYARAQALLTKHRLTMIEVESARERDGNPIKSGDAIFSGERIPTWMVTLAGKLARLNSCQALTFRNGDGVKLVLIGRTDDIEIVSYLFDSIVAQVEFLAHKARANKLGKGKTFYNNFKLGIVETVGEKLRAAAEAVRQEYTGTYAMVLVDQRSKEVADYVNSVIKPKTVTLYKNHDPEGFEEGKKAGHKVSINPGLKSEESKHLFK